MLKLHENEGYRCPICDKLVRGFNNPDNPDAHDILMHLKSHDLLQTIKDEQTVDGEYPGGFSCSCGRKFKYTEEASIHDLNCLRHILSDLARHLAMGKLRQMAGDWGNDD